MEQYRRAGAIDREAAARGRLVPYLTCRASDRGRGGRHRFDRGARGPAGEPVARRCDGAEALLSAYRGDDEAVVAWGKRTVELAGRFGDTEKRVDGSIGLATVELFRTGDARPLERTLDERRARTGFPSWPLMRCTTSRSGRSCAAPTSKRRGGSTRGSPTATASSSTSGASPSCPFASGSSSTAAPGRMRRRPPS